MTKLWPSLLCHRNCGISTAPVQHSSAYHRNRRVVAYLRQVSSDWWSVSDDVVHGDFDDAFLNKGVFETFSVGVHQDAGSDHAETLQTKRLLRRMLAVVPAQVEGVRIRDMRKSSKLRSYIFTYIV